MSSKLRFTWAAGLLALAACFSTGCTPSAVHPNQLNEFDGATYDTLLLAHSALTSLRTSVSRDFSPYTASFNQAASAYNQAVAAYGLYRASQVETDVDSTVKNLVLAIIMFENDLQRDLPVDPKQNAHVRSLAGQIRSRAAKAHVSVSDVLTELEIASAVAQTVLPAQPYSTLAQAIIQATKAALDAEQTSSGQPIDLQAIGPIALIS